MPTCTMHNTFTGLVGPSSCYMVFDMIFPQIMDIQRFRVAPKIPNVRMCTDFQNLLLVRNFPNVPKFFDVMQVPNLWARFLGFHENLEPPNVWLDFSNVSFFPGCMKKS